MNRSISPKAKFIFIGTIATVAIGLVVWSIKQEWFYSPSSVSIALDQEQEINDTPLNASTQSINRYYSKLRKLNKISVDFDAKQKKLNLKMDKSSGPESNNYHVYFREIDSRFLTPLLPYPRSESLSEFDRFNLMLSEYARNGISLSRQKDNKLIGSFYGSADFFNPNAAEYKYESGIIIPNEEVTPKRMSIVNNCLVPGLWEINAQDSVGEMYHGWFSMPKNQYFSMIRVNNNITASDWELRRALRYKKKAEVKLDLDKLRVVNGKLDSSKVRLSVDKKIGGYSTQDSRRKVQRGFFKVKREGKEISTQTFSDLSEGDIFELYAFIPPGIYSAKKFQNVPFDPEWSTVTINEVKPLTQFESNQSKFDDMGYMELILHSSDKSRAFVVGNIPFSLLVLQEDYDIPALGIGVLPASEPIERRYLRLKEGPAPHYAYMTSVKDDGYYGVNNHEYGIEQIFLRPFEKEGSLFLRMTFVSYERIMDLLEIEIPLNEKLTERIMHASSNYQRPLFRTYLDSNIL